jgi:NAD(P)H-dependent FMN reductase
MYNGTISGSYKNALDWLKLLGDRNPPYLTDKVVGLISTAGGMQGLQAVNTMEFVVRALRGWVVPLVMPIAQAWKAFDKQGVAQDAQLTEHCVLGERSSQRFLSVCSPNRRPERTRQSGNEVTPLSDEEAKIA